MKIEKNKVVSISYHLEAKSAEGETIINEKVEEGNPMVFLYGQSGLPEKFEAELDGLSEGQDFSFIIDSDEAYGEFENEAIVRLSKDIFKVNGQFDENNFKPGSYIPMRDPDGNMLQGKILEVGNDDIRMDFNHPLAGLNLHFKGQVLEIRDASPEEISHGHVHGPGGHHH